MSFKKAVKSQLKARISLAGPAGSGKTYTALAIASQLGENIAVIDTENASAAKYADKFSFDVMEMEAPFHPNKLVDAMQEAIASGYDVLVVDGLSPFWSGEGGLLEIVDQIAKKSSSGNSFTAWKQGTPIQNKLVEAIVRCKIHLICTIRSKVDYVLDDYTNKSGGTSKTPKKVGMAPIQREGFDYEFDIAGDLNLDHDLIITKTRCEDLDGKVFTKAGREIGQIIKNWLESGKPAVQADRLEGWDTIQDFLKGMEVKFGFAPEEVKAMLKEGGFTGWPTTGARQKSIEMHNFIESKFQMKTANSIEEAEAILEGAQ